MRYFFLLLLIACTIASSPLSAQPSEGGITFFEGGWKAALKKAAQSNKSIFVDGYTTWCGPCKRMNKEVFPQTEVGNYFNENFVNIKIDMEHGEGVEFAEAYDVARYPTFLFFNPQGELVHRSLGFQAPETLLATARDAQNPDKQLYTLKKKYEAGDKKLAKAYALALKAAAEFDAATTAADVYLNTLKPKQRCDAKNMDFIMEMGYAYNGLAFATLSENAKSFSKKYGKDRVYAQIQNGLENRANIAGQQSNKDDLNAALAQADALFDQPEKIKGDLQLLYYSAANEWQAFANIAQNHIERYHNDNVQFLNQAAWTFYEQIDNPDLLEKALKWSERSLQLEKSYYNMDTYAALLYKLNRLEQAKAAATEAIEIAKKDNQDYSETSKLLEKMAK